MTGPHKKKTAAELMAELQARPEFRARQEAKERAQAGNVRRYRDSARGVLADLKENGITVDAIGDLLHSVDQLSAAVPVLVEWLSRVSYPPLKEDIVRTLSVPWARSLAWQPLVDEYRRLDPEADGDMRWVIANALQVLASDDVLEDLIELVQDVRNGKSREMLALALGNTTRSRRVVGVLQGLLRDEVTVGHAIMALSRLGAAEALPGLRELVDHPNEWVRREARKAVASLEG